MPKISDTFQLPNKQLLTNRIMKSALSEGLGDSIHQPTPILLQLYRTWAAGGTGLLVTGNVMVQRTALGEPGNVVLDEQSDLGPFREWAQTGPLWMQLNHPGRQSTKGLNRENVAPSAVPFSDKLSTFFPTPRALRSEEISEIIQAFANAARLAKEAGFRGVQIHGAHGYLVRQFLSPLTNQRTDEWGGTPENRRRFLFEVIRAVRKAVGSDMAVGLKLNSADFQKGGFTEEESLAIIRLLVHENLDLLEISGGTYEVTAMVGGKESTRVREGFFLDFVKKAREIYPAPLAVTGGFRSTKGMNDALESGAVDLVGLGRALCLEPSFSKRALEDSHARIEVRRFQTGYRLVDMMETPWYELQIKRIGQGQSPKPHESVWLGVLRILLDQGWKSFRRKRA